MNSFNKYKAASPTFLVLAPASNNPFLLDKFSFESYTV